MRHDEGRLNWFNGEFRLGYAGARQGDYYDYIDEADDDDDKGDKGVRLNMHTMVMERELSITDSAWAINICYR